MEYNKMTATIIGTTEDGTDFTEKVEFTLLPPADGESYYGTGYYMRAKTPHHPHLIDVRYEGTTDIEILADRWINSWYGKNAKEVIKQFPSPEPELVPMHGAEKLSDLKKQYSE